MSVAPAALLFSTTDDEAQARFREYAHQDPFVGAIQPALLNSADIFDYVRVTGMIHPFEIDQHKLGEKLKGGSYEIDFLGEVHWSDESGLQKRVIAKNSVFALKKNSIAFVYLDTVFRLPHYMAVRFNLRITHVHRGLLLGTGPLVDPGFVGRLLVPLHNLTSEDYVLIGGEGFIWAEFTKLSPFAPKQPTVRDGVRKLFAITERKTEMDPQKYFNRASSGVPARSSIPGEVREAKRIAQETSRRVNRYTWGGVLTGALTVLGLVGATWSLISDANKSVHDSSRNVVDSRKELNELQRKAEDLAARVKAIETKLAPANSPKPGK